MAITVGAANVDVNANLAPFLAGMGKAKQVTDDFVQKSQEGWVKAAAKITAVSLAISYVSKQLQDLSAPGQTATESLQRGLITVAEQSAIARIGLAGLNATWATTLARWATFGTVAGAAAATAVWGLRSLTSAVVEQYQGIQKAREEAKLYEEQMKALADVARGLRGVTGGVLTAFAVQHGTQGDIRPEALRAATDLLPLISKRMGDTQRASQALAVALRDPTKAFEALRLAGIEFSKEQLDMFRNVDTTAERLQAQTVIIQELQNQLFVPDQRVSGWVQLSAAIAGFIDRFTSIKFTPIKDLVEWSGRVFDSFMRWTGLTTVFEMLDRQLERTAQGIQRFNRYWLPQNDLERFQAYEQQIKDIRDSIQRMRDDVTNSGNDISRRFNQALLNMAEPGAEAAIKRIQESTGYQNALINAHADAMWEAERAGAAYIRMLELQREATANLLRPLQQRLDLMRQSNTMAEFQARAMIAPLGHTPGTPEYNEALRNAIDLMGRLADEQARLSGTTVDDQGIRALGNALIESEAAAKRLVDALRDLPATIASGTRGLQEQLTVLQQSGNRAELNARMSLESLVQQGILVRGSEQYNAALRQRVGIYRSIAQEERRVALASSGKMSVFERENMQLTQQIQLYRYGSEEMAVQNRLLSIRMAAIQAQQPLNDQQAQQLETRIRQLRQIQQMSSAVNEAFSSAFNSMANALTEFAVTGKFNMKAFADEIIRQLLRIALQAMVVKPLLDAITGFTNTALGGASVPGSTTSPIVTGRGASLGSFASGGEFTVPGRNSGDQPYLIGLSGGERVNVTPSGQKGSSGAVTIINNVQSSKDFDVQTQERTGPGGERIIEQVFTEVMKRFGRGDADNTMGARYGMRPRTVQR